ncbi:MAG: VOC family protein [Draconibacterium sp.]|nr:VOC family protein [Draconibacterium sp.]
MTTVNVYLTYDGNCEEAFNFYKSVFGGEFTFLGRFKDMPPMEGVPPMDGPIGERVMHVSLPISKETVLMGSDSGGEWGPKLEVGNNFSISVNVDSKDEADRIFKSLSEGGQVQMEMQSTFWGDYFGNFIDKYGVGWMVSFPENPQK